MNYLEENKGLITQTKLKAFNYCEYQYFLGYVLEKHEELEPTEAMIEGTIIDEFISLKKKGFWKKWKIVKRRMDKSCELTQRQWDKVEESVKELQRQKLFGYRKRYDCQTVLFANYKGLKLKIKPDRFSIKKKEIRDLKRCKEIVSQNNFPSFEADIDKYDYDFQLAFYYIVTLIDKEIDCRCFIDAIDKTANNCFQVYEISKERIANNSRIIQNSLNRLTEAQKKNKYEACDNREKCYRCRMYKYCDKTAVQAKPLEI